MQYVAHFAEVLINMVSIEIEGGSVMIATAWALWEADLRRHGHVVCWSYGGEPLDPALVGE